MLINFILMVPDFMDMLRMYFLFIFFYYFSGIVEQPGRKEEEAFKDAIETTLDDSDENISRTLH